MGQDFTGREDERLWEQDDARLARKKKDEAIDDLFDRSDWPPVRTGIQTGIPHVDTAEVKRMVEMLRSNAQDYHERYIEHEEFTRVQKDIWDNISMKGVDFVDHILDVLYLGRPS